jgi:hypothetical protein
MCDHHFPGKVCIPDPAHVAADGTGVPVISFDANNGDVFIGGPPCGFGHRGRLILTNAAGDKTYEIDGATGTTSQMGDIVLLDENGHERVRISGKNAEMTIKNAAGDLIVHLDGKTGDFLVGGNGQDGDVIVRNSASLETMRLDGNAATLIAGGNGQDGDVIVRDSAGNIMMHLDGNSGDLTVGGSGQDGDVIVRNSAGLEAIRLDGNAGDLTIGGNGQDGDVVVRNVAGNETIRLDGSSGDLTVGGSGQDGDVSLRSTTGNETVHLDGGSGDLTVGGNGQAGDVVVRNAANGTPIRLNGGTGQAFVEGIGVAAPLNPGLRLNVAGKTQTVDLEVTGDTRTKDITVTNAANTPTIELDGTTGDIRLLNADCAEDFDVVAAEEIEPGTVMTLSDDGKLRQSIRAYDKKVAGVISGAGQYKPGIVLDKQEARENRLPVALMGKVYCKVDANYSPINVGDLLTTSLTPGHAMRADDPFQAFGAVIGKALRSLETGQDLIPILIALQ